MNLTRPLLEADRDRWTALREEARARVARARAVLDHAEADLADATGMVATLENILRRQPPQEQLTGLDSATPTAATTAVVTPTAPTPSGDTFSGLVLPPGQARALLEVMVTRPDATWTTREVQEAMRVRGALSDRATDPNAALRPVIHRTIKSGLLERGKVGRYRLTPLGVATAKASIEERAA